MINKLLLLLQRNVCLYSTIYAISIVKAVQLNVKSYLSKKNLNLWKDLNLNPASGRWETKGSS